VRFAIDDRALARTLLGSDDSFAVVALTGPGADSVRIDAPGAQSVPRQEYVDGLAATQVAASSFVKIIAEFFAVIVAACLLAALVFAATLLVLGQRPQLQILWKVGVSARTRAAILAAQVLALVAVSAAATLAVFGILAAVVPAGWTALGTFTVQSMRATPAALVASTALVAVVLLGAFAFGMRLDRQDGPQASALRRLPVAPVVGVVALVVGGYMVLRPVDGGFTWIVVGHCLLVIGAYALCAPLLALVSRLRSVGTFRGVLLPWFGFGGIARAKVQARVVVAFLVFVSSLVAVVSVFASSTNASISRQIDANVGAQFVAEPKAGFTIDDRDVAALRAVPGPGTVLAVSPQQVTSGGAALSGIAIDGSLSSGALLVTLRDGTERVAPGTALLSEATAARLGARVGGDVEIGGARYGVGGVYANAPTLGDFVIAAPPASAYAYVLVTATGDRDLKAALSPAVPTGTVRSIGDYQIQQAKESQHILDALQQLSLISGLGLLLALVVVLGVLNAGRSGEWRALARLGLRRSRIVATIAIEAAAIAVLSVIAGLAVGVLTGIGVCRYLATSGLSDIVVDPVLIGAAFIGLTGVGVAVYVLTSLGVLRRISF
jgi:putative ABC transport system permease protein